MNPMTLRSTTYSSGEWLIGKYVFQLDESKFPTKRDVLSFFLFNHYEQNQTITKSLDITADFIMKIWKGIIIKKKFYIKENIGRLFEKWQKLKKNRLRNTVTQKNKEKEYLNSLNEIFDCSKRDNSNQSEKSKKLIIKNDFTLSSSQSSHQSHTSISSHEFYPSPPQKKQKLYHKKKQDIITPTLSSILDRTRTSNRTAMLLVSTTSSFVGQDIENMNISVDTIRRTRQKYRIERAKEIKESFSPNVPLTVHWDSKIMKNYKSTGTADRLAVLVTGEGVTKLLGIPVVDGSSGLSQSNAVYDLLVEWNISGSIKSMSFDTTASNTGEFSGACVCLEEKLNKKLLALACRHHILELILSTAFSKLLEPTTSGPTIKLFEKFKNHWPKLNKNDYEAGLIETDNEIEGFIIQQLNCNHPRDDYNEFLNLALIYINKNNKNNTTINIPGAYHRARWMAKIIYCLKIYIFRKQFNLTARELKGLKEFNDFIVKIYLKNWFLCSSPTSVPRTDLQLLKDLIQYKNQNKILASAALVSFSRHLWYLSEYLIGLSFFDEGIATETKVKMVAALDKEASTTPPKRIKIKETDILHKEIHHFITKNTFFFFEALNISTGFLKTNPETWKFNEEYLNGLKTVKALKIVNDTAERGIALMQFINQSITIDEDQRQYLLQIVEENRLEFPNTTKTDLIKKLKKY